MKVEVGRPNDWKKDIEIIELPDDAFIDVSNDGDLLIKRLDGINYAIYPKYQWTSAKIIDWDKW